MERDRRLDGLYDKFIERPLTYIDRLGPVLAVNDKLADHRVVIWRDIVAGIGVGIEPYAAASRSVEYEYLSGARHEFIVRVLSIDAALYRASGEFYLLLLASQALSRRDPYYITPILMGISMFVQQKMSMTTVTDPQQRSQQRMMLIMPFIFTYTFLSLPSGLVVYWFVNNILGIVQQVLINRQAAAIGAPGAEEAGKA